MTPENATKIRIEFFRALENGGSPRDRTLGICAEYKSEFRSSMNVDLDAHGIDLTDWPHYSGEEYFPVPPTDGRLTDTPSMSAAEKQFMRTCDLWSGKQGDLRRDLCGWIADRLGETL
jgi:hypothetical protein